MTDERRVLEGRLRPFSRSDVRPVIYDGLRNAQTGFPSPIHGASGCDGLSRTCEKPRERGCDVFMGHTYPS